MNPITKFFHELINPHCLHCAELRNQELEQKAIQIEADKFCNSCENLKMQLALVNQQNEKLINLLTQSKEPVNKVSEVKQQVIQTRQVPWRVKQQELEAASRIRANELKQNMSVQSKAVKPDNSEAVNKLEESIGITNAADTKATEAINT